MARIHNLKIRNFRGIKSFDNTFNNSNLICLVGRGDSGKTTILNAISNVLSPRWNLTFFDSDFYNCDINTTIEIEVTLIDLPENIILESKYGLHIRGIDKSTKEIHDELEDNHEKALTIKLEIKKDLEPKWFIINNRQETPIPISSYDRAKLNVFMISDYIDRHFSWSKGNPLYSLLKQQQDAEDSEENNIIIESIREAKNKIDDFSFDQLTEVTEIIKLKSAELGFDISNTSTSIDFKDISVKEGRVCLHDDKVPFRLKGKGSKRLISIAIQTSLADKGGIVLIDEIEQGLEPDRVKHLVRTLEKDINGQIFLTTHSQSVIEEISINKLMMIKNTDAIIQCTECDEKFQKVIRICPEAAYAKKVIMCEGKTEIGICRALDNYRINQSLANLSSCNVVYSYGEGSSFPEIALQLKKQNKDVCVFCDSDVELNPSKEELTNEGIQIFDAEEGNCIENQIFKALPWHAIKELIELKEKKLTETAVKVSVNSDFDGTLTTDWKETERIEKRTALGKTAKRKKWFKRIDYGEFLGNIIFKYFEDFNDQELHKQLNSLSNWISSD